VGLSEGALSRLFRKETAKTFIDCLNDVRIAHSADLLQKTGDLISEIACDCGFSSIRHFTAIFRRKKGMPPGAYRKNTAGVFEANSRTVRYKQ
jgi:AraC family transcriptional regulator of arabinose operon